ncbi:putative outermembrane protein [Winogradskyella psychrotolerans RS-3]|uniref:Putative outermembrane protein n=1 Tax=Winogradskyella psychrotolerans RS-3 TaxID=641526 RepID=S7VUZ9_9FLAO|nr:outer membrane protein [Winogradskyella psychrotolerans]EPR73891.1 putative outermembrane protein [Winogradskyella psychrotolerans RS-3]
MNYLNRILSLGFTLLCTIANSQTQETLKYSTSNKGKLFISWGGNRGAYSKSDIRFKGDDYDFTISDATAKDKPKGWHIDYINPTRMTIPQTNAKLGYFISDHYTVSIGLDHMKYVMNRDRNRNVNGYINLPDNEPGSNYNGEFDDENVFISSDLLKFEHTDGLNFIYTEIARYDDISSLFHINNTDKFQVNITEGIGGGLLFPRTNTTLLQKDRYDEFHVSGYGLSANIGLNLTFFKHFFIQLNAKGGYIDMNNIRTTNDSADHAEQSFYFFQRVVSFGTIFKLKK